jgi:hypothetical protein
MSADGMRRLLAAAAFLIAISCAADARAQARDWPERFWVGVSGGFQPAANGFDDAFDLPLYQETERVTVDYPVKGGPLVAASGGYRVWKRFTVGLGVTRYSRRADATVRAQLPHPFFDNQFRAVEGTTSTLRGETAAHLLLGWMLPVTDRFRVIVTAGPSFVSVEQTVVTAVEFSEVFPYDTAEFTGATTRRSTRSATGFNAGGDVTWMFSSRFGAGGLVQFTRARARVGAGEGRTIAVDAGGAQAALGVRLFF